MASTENESRGGAPAGLEALFGSLSDRLGRSARAAAVFGDPVEGDGVTVIPVARARWGVGGGSGKRPNRPQEGVGGGGGAIVSPVGFIEIRGGRAIFKPVVDLKVVLGVCLAAMALMRFAFRRRCE